MAAPPTILGISAFYHDSAAAIVRGGEIVAAAQEERFSRKRHDPRFPAGAINYCLGEAFVEPSELAAVAFYDNPVMTTDRVVQSFLAVAPQGQEQWRTAVRSMLGQKARLGPLVAQSLGTPASKLLFVDHHISHAASAFYPSPYEAAAILVVDGVGEWSTTSIGFGRGAEIELLREIRYPHSLGLLYGAFTYYCGFKVNSGEYKLMGLAPYGQPRYAAQILEHLIDLRPDGSFRLNMDYFAFMDEGVMTNERFHRLFGAAPREPESRIEVRHMDLAASIQQVTDQVMCRLAAEARRLTGADRLTMAGGVALNCVANGKILRDGLAGLWVQPAAGDAGGALGAALYASHRYFGTPRSLPADGRDLQRGSSLGPGYSSAEIRSFLDTGPYPSEEIADRGERARAIAAAIADGKVVGLFSGRMEFGPRALGSRSILGDPRRQDMQSLMNLKIKFRESFRPFAPAVLHDRAAEYFELEGESGYMLVVAPVRAERCIPGAVDWSAFREGGDMIPAVNAARSDIPAVTHVDYSARVQTVHPAEHAEFHAILSAFDALTGCPVLVNTSFNVRGEPIVCTPQEAYRCFMRTGIDLLVLEEHLLWKSAQPRLEGDDDWQQTIERD